jgi:Histidine kinase-like ATPase domain
MIMMPPTADTRHHCRSKAWRRFGTPQARRHLTTRDSSAGPLRPPPTVENAVQHARTPFQVTAEITGGSLRVEVTDSGGGTPAARPLPDPASPRGRGLFLVDLLSDAWGTSPSAGAATSVWFTITLDAGGAARNE